MPYIITFLIYIIFFLFQKHLIFPVESFFFPIETLQLVSVLYLPHSIRVLSYYILGFFAVIPIFLAQCFTYVYFNDASIIDSACLSFISTFSIVLGFKFFYFINKKVYLNIKQKVDWKILIILSSFISIFNSFLSSFYLNFNSSFFQLSVIFKFLIGDVLGMIVSMFVFIFIIKLIRIRLMNETR